MSQPIPNKNLGQHWLHDEPSLLAMVEAADVKEADFVVEIGPGLGTLTQYLLDAGAQVLAIEYDKELAKTLSGRVTFAKDQLSVIEADIMQFNFNQLPAGYKIVANIPYYLTSGLLRILSESDNPPLQAALLVQKEVAERVCAEPGQTSLLSISTQMYFDCSLGSIVTADLFTPPPKIDSQILILNRRQQPYFADIDPKLLFRVVKAGFSERRKKLRSSLSGGLSMSKTETDEFLLKSGISGDLRAQNLSLDDWITLAKHFAQITNEKLQK